MSTSRPELRTFGWDDAWEQRFLELSESVGFSLEERTPGRVVLELRGVCSVRTESGEVEAAATGRMRHEAAGPGDLPSIGDWVVLEPPAREGDAGRIHAVLPRRTRFSRKVAGAKTQEQVVAANVDTLFVVMGLDGDFSLRRLERFLAAGLESGAQTVVLLNKSDLAEDLPEQLAEVQAIVLDAAPVHVLSAKRDEGTDALAPYLIPGHTIALVGSSGVGKSTLINRLAGTEQMKTGDVRSGDDRGKHTTSHRELVQLESGALLIDNPGIRELQLWDAEQGLSGTFEDVEGLAEHCRFRDCRHEGEPGCAVLAGVESGELATERIESYRALQRELAHLDRRQNESAAIVEKKKWRAIHRAARKHKPRG